MAALNGKPKVRDQAQGPGWMMWNGDCVEVLPGIKDDSVGFVIYSPPFADLFSIEITERGRIIPTCQSSSANATGAAKSYKEKRRAFTLNTIFVT